MHFNYQTGTFEVPSSKLSHFIVKIVKKSEWRDTPYVINESLQNFQEIQV